MLNLGLLTNSTYLTVYPQHENHLYQVRIAEKLFKLTERALLHGVVFRTYQDVCQAMNGSAKLSTKSSRMSLEAQCNLYAMWMLFGCLLVPSPQKKN